MRLIDRLFPRRAKNRTGTEFRTVADYSPAFTTYGGGVYEQALTRRAVDAFATAVSKLKPVCTGTAQPQIQRAFKTAPNRYMTWPQFLYRAATICEVDTTLAVVPVFGSDLQTYTGLWPLKFDSAQVFTIGSEPWVRFYLPSGDVMAIELEKVAFVNKFQYESDFFGSDNVLDGLMMLMDYQEQAQKNAIQNGARIEWIGAVDGMIDPDDTDRMRSKFAEDNLTADNDSGLLIYDSRFRDLKQVEPRSYTISNEEMERIERNVFFYFGVNEKILTNSYDEATWDAFYEGKVEPFGLMLSESVSKMLFTQRERLNNGVSFSSNRLEYTSAATKRNMIRDMFDRGLINPNEAREILQMPPIEGGDKYYIRGEYIDASMVSEHTLNGAKGDSAVSIPSTDEDFDGGDKEYLQKDGDGDEKDQDGRA